jgi:rSAM/selenodomain-associated transferase 1
MVKEPRMGAVKTRLARDVGAVAATQFYRHLTTNLIRRLALDRRWRLVLAIAPDRAIDAPIWPRTVVKVGQGRGDIGARMARLLRVAGPGPAVLIGSDIPAVSAEHIAAAFAELKRNDAVFGPVADGGFWLVGLRRSNHLAGLFDGVRWSGPNALADTLANLARCKIGFTSTLVDVDDGQSYERAGRAGSRVTLFPGDRRYHASASAPKIVL